MQSMRKVYFLLWLLPLSACLPSIFQILLVHPLLPHVLEYYQVTFDRIQSPYNLFQASIGRLVKYTPNVATLCSQTKQLRELVIEESLRLLSAVRSSEDSILQSFSVLLDAYMEADIVECVLIGSQPKKATFKSLQTAYAYNSVTNAFKQEIEALKNTKVIGNSNINMFVDLVRKKSRCIRQAISILASPGYSRTLRFEENEDTKNDFLQLMHSVYSEEQRQLYNLKLAYQGLVIGSNPRKTTRTVLGTVAHLPEITHPFTTTMSLHALTGLWEAKSNDSVMKAVIRNEVFKRFTAASIPKPSLLYPQITITDTPMRPIVNVCIDKHYGLQESIHKIPTTIKHIWKSHHEQLTWKSAVDTLSIELHHLLITRLQILTIQMTEPQRQIVTDVVVLMKSMGFLASMHAITEMCRRSVTKRLLWGTVSSMTVGIDKLQGEMVAARCLYQLHLEPDSDNGTICSVFIYLFVVAFNIRNSFADLHVIKSELGVNSRIYQRARRLIINTYYHSVVWGTMTEKAAKRTDFIIHSLLCSV